MKTSMAMVLFCEPYRTVVGSPAKVLVLETCIVRLGKHREVFNHADDATC